MGCSGPPTAWWWAARAERHSPNAILRTLTPTSGSDALARLEQNRMTCHIPVVERPARALAGATGCRWMGSSAPSDLSELSDRLEDDAAR